MHAYMIIAHNQFALLEKLIKSLDDERNDIFIHIDAKVADFDFEHFLHLTEHSRVIFTENRVNITWGDESQVECEKTLLRCAVSHEDPDKPYEYYHLLSGVDLPIKSNDEIHAFFAEHAGKEFIHYSAAEVEATSVTRLKYYHFFRKKRNLFNKILAQIALKIQILFGVDRLKGKNIKVQKGCNWFSVTGDFARYAVSKLDEYEPVFKYTYCGDEVFIQTLLVNSPYSGNLFMPDCGNDHSACARLIDWQRGNPYVWRIDDLEEIKASPCMFARKFDENTDGEIIDEVLRMRG